MTKSYKDDNRNDNKDDDNFKHECIIAVFLCYNLHNQNNII